MSEQTVRKTPLYDCHVASNGRIVDFAGWQMPIQYQGIMAEHKIVREHIGLFDVSHMGRIEIEGKAALQWIQNWITNDASKLEDGQALYSPICYPEGGIVDDCYVYRYAEGHYMIVVNASNREKDFQWFSDHIPEGLEDAATMHSLEAGDRLALLAIQGPKTRTLLSRLTDFDFSQVKHNQVFRTTLAGIANCTLACTGYTGEDGFEIFVPSEHAAELWDKLLDEGKPEQIAPCGLGARDTLRMEMKYPLYGQDIDQQSTPIEAGLSWTVKPDKGDFVGREAIVKQIQGKPPRRLIGFILEERGVARHGHKILSSEGEVVGEVTSGGFAPSLKKSIGIGYVPAKPHLAKIGSQLFIEVRGKKIPAKVVRTPFYRPKQSA